jgi:hypothetical protein
MSLRHLTRFELVWARAAFEAIFPGHAGGARGIGTMDIEAYLEETFGNIPLEPAVGMRIAIWTTALAPLFVLGRFATLHRLSAPDRERVVSRLVVNPVYAVRQLVLALKAIAALLYAGDREVRAAMVAPSSPAVPLQLKRKPEKTPSVPPPGTKGGRRVAVA